MKTLTTYLAIFLFSISLSAQSTFFKTFHLDDPAITTEFHKITQTNDGGFLITGSHSLVQPWVYVIKLDQNGQEVWRLLREPFENAGLIVEKAMAVVESNGEYIILGCIAYPNQSQKSTVLLSIDKATGIINNIHEIETLRGAICNQMILTHDNHLVILGYDGFNAGHLYSWMTFLKVNLQGEVQWIQKYEEAAISSSPSSDQGGLFQDDNDDFWLAGGGRNPEVNGRKVSIVKTDVEGNLIWTYQNQESYQARSVAKIISDIVVTVERLEDKEDVLLKISNNGKLLWSKDLSDYYSFSAIRCVSAPDDAMYVTGSDDSGLVILKIDTEGNIVWEKKIPLFEEADRANVRNVIRTKDGGIAIIGYAFIEPWTFHDGAYVLRLNSDGEFGDIVNTQNDIALYDFDIDVFPNPTTDIVTIKNNATVAESYQLTVYDLKGVQQDQTELSEHSTTINMQNYSSGAYILEFRTTDNQILHKTIVKE